MVGKAKATPDAHTLARHLGYIAVFEKKVGFPLNMKEGVSFWGRGDQKLTAVFLSHTNIDIHTETEDPLTRPPSRASSCWKHIWSFH